MSPISDSLRLVAGIIAGIFGILATIIATELSKNLGYWLRRMLPGEPKSGEKPRKRSPWLWALLYISIGIFVCFTAFAAAAPSPRDISPSPTAQAFPSAENGETLIIIVPFAGSSENYSVYPERYIRDALQKRITLLNMSGHSIRLEIYPTALTTQREVRQVGESYNATLIIWGEFDDVGGMRAYVEILSSVPKYDSQQSSNLIPFLSLPAEGGEVVKVSRDCVLQGMPDQADYLTMISLGMIDLISGKRNESDDFFTQALEIIPSLGECNENPYQAYYWRGLTRSFQGNFQAALDDLNQAITLESSDRLAIAQRGVVYLAVGRTTDAENDFKNAIKLFHPEEHESLAILYDNLGITLALQGQYEEAEKYLKQANQAIGENGDKLVRALNLEHLGSLYQLMGQSDTAYEYHNQALSICREIQSNPCEAITLGNIGLIFKVRGDLDAALVFVEQALKLANNSQFILGQATELVQLGDIYLKRGELETARTNFESALDISEKSGLLYNQTQAYIGLAMVENQLGNTDMVLMNLQSALYILEDIGSPDANLVRQKIQEIKP